ncbi:MAG TPA: hypothetical protein VHB30_08425, partial [Solirubrobacteraceae bacterium]|nr:hypothetical protein [Solirubrobacteraceae bacterium]
LLERDPAVDGIKTGHTHEAGYVLVGSATRDGVTVLSAVLGTDSEADRDADSIALLRYGLSRYRAVAPVVTGRRLATAKVSEQGSDRVDLVAAGTATTVLRSDERATLRLVGVPASVKGPLPARTREGAVEVVSRGRTVATVPLETARAVPRASVAERLRAWLGRAITVLLLVALATCSLLLVLLRRRTARRRRRVPRTRTGES